MPENNQDRENNHTFIDVFAGCGGLSLGLMQSGWQGLAAIEKSPMAFATLKYNLIDQDSHPRFTWPDWLNTDAIDIKDFLDIARKQQDQLKNITLLAGGPPCQGFSRAGQRKQGDERNYLLRDYIQLVEIIQPKMILLENVSGFTKTFDRSERGENGVDLKDDEKFNAEEELQIELVKLKYRTFAHYPVMAKSFGVPQLRPRYILIGIAENIIGDGQDVDPFKKLYGLRDEFLRGKGLPIDREITLKEAISDLLLSYGTRPCVEKRMKRFRQGMYGPIDGQYQKVMRHRRNGEDIPDGELADSHRFPNHNAATEARFKNILQTYPLGKQLSEEDLKKLQLNKHRVAPLSPSEACHTLTGLPDDLIHYSEPRIPTVREYARIQSFPDWFEFKSNYTSGGERRRVEVPRYTQVANAVPPLLAEAIGNALSRVYEDLISRKETEGQSMDVIKI